jgi:hypothetical protein
MEMSRRTMWISSGILARMLIIVGKISNLPKDLIHENSE